VGSTTTKQNNIFTRELEGFSFCFVVLVLVLDHDQIEPYALVKGTGIRGGSCNPSYWEVGI
jgi:hypothetical protein